MKRVLTAGAVGLGLGGMAAAIREDDADRGAEDDSERGADGASQHGEREHQPDLVLVFAYDYHSNALFRPIDRLPQGTVNAILGRRVGGEPVVSEPTDYNGYVVLVKLTPDAPGEYAFVFVNEETLQEDQWYRFTDDVVFFNTDINLLSAGLTTVGGVEATTTEETTTDEGEITTDTEETPPTTAERTTPADETTTHDVVVKTTETNDE